MNNETIELMASAGNRTTGGGAIVSIFGWLASSNAIGVLGLAVAILGALVNWYYKREADRRAMAQADLNREEQLLRIKLMRATGIPTAQPTCPDREEEVEL